VNRGIQSASGAFADRDGFGVNIRGIEAILMTPTPVQQPVNSPYYVPGSNGNIMDVYNNYGLNTSVAQTTIQAKVLSIRNPTLPKAMASGALMLNGVLYNFTSGGGGNGYLPYGTYTITNCRSRSDEPSMMIDGFGFSCDLNDAKDARTGVTRTLLRIHPDGGATGTLGCVGIVGDINTQKQFLNSILSLIKSNGGRYTLTVGQ